MVYRAARRILDTFRLDIDYTCLTDEIISKLPDTLLRSVTR
jgi:hypothetical protein